MLPHTRPNQNLNGKSGCSSNHLINAAPIFMSAFKVALTSDLRSCFAITCVLIHLPQKPMPN